MAPWFAPESTYAQAGELWEKMLSLCTPGQRELLELKRQGFTLNEIAERTGIPERTVRWSLNEGFRALAELMLREPVDIRRVS